MPEPDRAKPLRQAKISRRMQLLGIRLLGLQSHAAKAVFLGEDGEVTPQGEKLIALLAYEARLNQHGFNGDADRRLFDAGAQHIVRTLIEWVDIDTAKIARAQQRLQNDSTGWEP